MASRITPEDLLRDFKDGKFSGRSLLRKLSEHLYRSQYLMVDDTARIDTSRETITGVEEVIYAEGKAPDQLERIVKKVMMTHPPSVSKKSRAPKKLKNPNLLITRLSPEGFSHLKRSYEIDGEIFPLVYHSDARVAHTPPSAQNRKTSLKKKRRVSILTAGTSDNPVAEECGVVLDYWGVKVDRYYDVGVGSLGRLLGVVEKVRKSQVVIVIAGMEAALASVVAGLVTAPIVAVPTSVGYGANFQGLSSLLGMMNSCSPGVMVVNIDNGFGAAAATRKILAIS